MASMSDSSPKRELIDEELVAYLDGELTPEQSQQVEARLGTDPEYRQRLRQLEHTWELLDELPPTDPTATFTRSTLEMVVSRATKDQNQLSKNIFTIPLRVIVMLGLPLALGAASYGLTRWYQSVPYADLLKDLTIIENVDVYSKAEQIEFLELLRQEGLFVETGSGDAVNE
jgi:uncharacterized membrane protein affecting hemolysin expression